MKIIVAGSRDFSDYSLLCSTLDTIVPYNDEVEIVSGTAKGADSLGEQYAKQHNLPITRFPADWNQYGKSAGYRRNVQMAEYADFLVAFWDGESKGTQHMINIAKSHKLPIVVIKY